MCGVYPASGVKTAGDQISSTYEGRHVTLRDDELIHKYTGALDDGFVDKGDAVVFCKAGNGTVGKGVGVAFIDGAASADLIPVDTEGIFALLVYADDDAGGSEVVPGDPLFIDTVTAQEGAAGVGIGCISKRRNLVSQVPFGYALGNIDSAGEGVIAVKLHWDPEEQQDEYAIFPDGHGADDMKMFHLVDQDDNASGMTHVLNIFGQYTAAKTGTAVFTGINIDIDPDNDCPYVYGEEVYTYVIADKTIGFLCAYSAYFEDYGNAVGSLCMIDLGKSSVHAPTGRNAFIRIREHGAAVLANSTFLQLEGANAVDYLLTFQNAAGAEDSGVVLEAESNPQTADYRIQVRLAGDAVDRYIHLFPI